MSTRADRMLEILLTGDSVGTDNNTCSQIGTNQVPDVARVLLKQNIDLKKDFVQVNRFGRKVKVCEYWLEQKEIDRIKAERAEAA